MIIKIDPCPAPRMTQSDRWRKPPRPCVARYYKFRDNLFQGYQKTLPVPCRMVFTIAMPEGWTAKKKLAQNGQPHLQMPDLDNLIKATIDALLKQDSYVWSFQAEKRWGYEGSIEIIP